MSARGLFFKKIIIGAVIAVGLAIPVGFRVWYLHAHEMTVKSLLGDFAYDKTTMTVFGVIDAEPDMKPTTQDFTVHVKKVSNNSASQIVLVDTRILVSTKLYPHYSYGDMVEISGTLARPRNFGDDNGRDFDYVHYLSKDGIFFVMKNPHINIIGTGAGNLLYAKLFAFKEAFLENIRHVLSEPQASLAAGEIVGDKASLGKTLTDEFRRSGLIHIVILSGYSIAIIADSIKRLLSVIPYLPRSASLASGAFGILFFGIMIGGKATAVRACIMAIVSILAQLMYRDYNALRALFFTAYLMTLQNPSIVPYDASFQVSFTATLGLILFGKHIEHQLKKFPRLFPERFEIRGLVTSTLATQIAVAPLLLYMMGDASVVSVIANIIVVPFIPATLLVIFCTGMSGFLLSLPGLLASISFYISFVAGAIAQVFLSYELLIVQFFGSFPYAIVTINNFSLWMMWCVYALYAIAYVFLKRYVKARDAARRKLLQNASRSPPN